ncbi:forkhead box protein Q1-like [Centruroides sculpturatus]|uniref:forkhead box protein Q1-like n=1 Tax=Centruroides sculpturatus TaxID=218467 RepID=UPI000C6D9C96|nr:forkhead box protein Q1-like [Centruroides sculpturatus]
MSTVQISESTSQEEKRNYHRRGKPPYSYITLIAMAIRDSPSGKLTLAEINEYLKTKFSFFQGEYTGWKNSIRHNLSLNDCFRKILKDPQRPWGKDNYWTLNHTSDFAIENGIFCRRKGRKDGKKKEKNYRKSKTSKMNDNPFSIENLLKPKQQDECKVDEQFTFGQFCSNACYFCSTKITNPS